MILRHRAKVPLNSRLTMARVVVFYLGLLIWPAHQSIDYSFDAFPATYYH